MPQPIESSALFRFLSRDVVLSGRAIELRATVSEWLSYIPHTFPHYTRHTVAHSDSIVRVLSEMLFVDGEITSRVLPDLSSVEAYILIASAYLHDAGMVASDTEIATILSSPEWSRWISTGGRSKRLEELNGFRNSNLPADDQLRGFLADVQLRHLVAEFVRQSHHFRSGRFLQEHEYLASFAFFDPILRNAIADVCIAHGLRPHELDDPERFPDRRDIRGEKVNLRLLAILLRLGDLLDMNTDRACPLLLSAASPLPADSVAHWTQYQRLTHFMVAPDRIEITARCQNQAEHRYLQDWCQWIEDEVVAAESLMARARRHSSWKPPYARLSGPSPPIQVEPAPTARYVPSKWTFEMDPAAILDRLIYDAYDDQLSFLRELIQNSADATRCRLYSEIVAAGQLTPESPTSVPEDARERYPIRVSVRSVRRPNAFSGEDEEHQVVTVSDSGIGMTREVIERYLLQVGRSYYASEEFRRQYRFVPTSRFGVGFLSVFAVSDNISVDTRPPGADENAEPIRLTLTGPRSYLLTERGTRAQVGTDVEVTLRTPIPEGLVRGAVERYCRRLEFPVVVSDHEGEVTIRAERADELVSEVPDYSDPGGKFIVRSFPVLRTGIEGEIFVFCRFTQAGESWGHHRWAKNVYLESDPRAAIPSLPETLVCFHGIADSEGHGLNSTWSYRVDLRGGRFRPDLSRSRSFTRSRGREMNAYLSEVIGRVDELLADHLASTELARGEDAWKYRQRLAGYIGSDSFWNTCSEAIPVYTASGRRLCSSAELRAIPLIRVVLTRPRGLRHRLLEHSHDEVGWERPRDGDIPILTESDLEWCSDRHRGALFDGRRLVKVDIGAVAEIICTWEVSKRPAPLIAGRESFESARLPWSVVGVPMHQVRGEYDWAETLNLEHPLTRWILEIAPACRAGISGLREEQFTRLFSMLHTTVKHEGYQVEKLDQYLKAWRELPGLPEGLRPPEYALTRSDFGFAYPPKVSEHESALFESD